tara:strand:- start:67 stop:321 length:255 start_codon:yes stop_codon:yes gene_type:complete
MSATVAAGQLASAVFPVENKRPSDRRPAPANLYQNMEVFIILLQKGSPERLQNNQNQNARFPTPASGTEHYATNQKIISTKIFG